MKSLVLAEHTLKKRELIDKSPLSEPVFFGITHLMDSKIASIIFKAPLSKTACIDGSIKPKHCRLKLRPSIVQIATEASSVFCKHT